MPRKKKEASIPYIPILSGPEAKLCVTKTIISTKSNYMVIGLRVSLVVRYKH